MVDFSNSIKASLITTIIFGFLCIIPYIFKSHNWKKNAKGELFKIAIFFILYSLIDYLRRYIGLY